MPQVSNPATLCGRPVTSVCAPLERTLLLQLIGLCLAGVAAHICVVLLVKPRQGVSYMSGICQRQGGQDGLGNIAG